MCTTRTRRLVISVAGAILLLLPVSPAVADGHGDRNRPIEMTFTKWVTTFPLMDGYWGDDLANKFAGEIFQRQVSQRQADNCFLPGQTAAASSGSRRSTSSTTATVRSSP